MHDEKMQVTTPTETKKAN